MRIVKARSDAQLAWPRLLADIGGTNARFAWLSGPGAPIEHIQIMACDQHAGPLQAIQSYLQQAALPVPDSAVLAMAIPVTGDVLQMTNLNWRFSMAELREQLGLQSLTVINDFTALALAIPELPDEHLIRLGEPKPAPHERSAKALLGAGTGLGVSGLLPLPHSKHWVPLMGEGGHVTLSARDRLEFEVIEELSKRHGHVSAERVLSGNGLVDVHQALCSLKGLAIPSGLTPARILALDAQSDPLARQTLDMFVAWMATVAGDLALTLGALGGVYIGGGIAPRLKKRFQDPAFRQRFEDKGRYRNYLQSIPTWLIDAPVSPALMGAAKALESASGSNTPVCTMPRF